MESAIKEVKPMENFLTEHALSLFLDYNTIVAPSELVLQILGIKMVYDESGFGCGLRYVISDGIHYGSIALLKNKFIKQTRLSLNSVIRVKKYYVVHSGEIPNPVPVLPTEIHPREEKSGTLLILSEVEVVIPGELINRIGSPEPLFLDDAIPEVPVERISEETLSYNVASISSNSQFQNLFNDKQPKPSHDKSLTWNFFKKFMSTTSATENPKMPKTLVLQIIGHTYLRSVFSLSHYMDHRLYLSDGFFCGFVGILSDRLEEEMHHKMTLNTIVQIHKYMIVKNEQITSSYKYILFIKDMDILEIGTENSRINKPVDLFDPNLSKDHFSIQSRNDLEKMYMKYDSENIIVSQKTPLYLHLSKPAKTIISNTKDLYFIEMPNLKSTLQNISKSNVLIPISKDKHESVINFKDIFRISKNNWKLGWIYFGSSYKVSKQSLMQFYETNKQNFSLYGSTVSPEKLNCDFGDIIETNFTLMKFSVPLLIIKKGTTLANFSIANSFKELSIHTNERSLTHTKNAFEPESSNTTTATESFEVSNTLNEDNSSEEDTTTDNNFNLGHVDNIKLENVPYPLLTDNNQTPTPTLTNYITQEVKLSLPEQSMIPVSGIDVLALEVKSIHSYETDENKITKNNGSITGESEHNYSISSDSKIDSDSDQNEVSENELINDNASSNEDEVKLTKIDDNSTSTSSIRINVEDETRHPVPEIVLRNQEKELLSAFELIDAETTFNNYTISGESESEEIGSSGNDSEADSDIEPMEVDETNGINDYITSNDAVLTPTKISNNSISTQSIETTFDNCSISGESEDNYNSGSDSEIDGDTETSEVVETENLNDDNTSNNEELKTTKIVDNSKSDSLKILYVGEESALPAPEIDIVHPEIETIYSYESTGIEATFDNCSISGESEDNYNSGNDSDTDGNIELSEAVKTDFINEYSTCNADELYTKIDDNTSSTPSTKICVNDKVPLPVPEINLSNLIESATESADCETTFDNCSTSGESEDNYNCGIDSETDNDMEQSEDDETESITNGTTSNNDEPRATIINDNSTSSSLKMITELESMLPASEITLAHPEGKPVPESELAGSETNFKNCSTSGESENNYNSGSDCDTDSDPVSASESTDGVTTFDNCSISGELENYSSGSDFEADGVMKQSEDDETKLIKDDIKSNKDKLRVTKIDDNFTSPVSLKMSVEENSTLSALENPDGEAFLESKLGDSENIFENCSTSSESEDNYNSNSDSNTESDIEPSDVCEPELIEDNTSSSDNVLTSIDINVTSASSFAIRTNVEGKTMLPVTDIDVMIPEDEPIPESESAVCEIIFDNCNYSEKSEDNYNSGSDSETDIDMELSKNNEIELVDLNATSKDNILTHIKIDESSVSSASLMISVEEKIMLHDSVTDLTSLEDEPVPASESAVCETTFDNCSNLGESEDNYNSGNASETDDDMELSEDDGSELINDGTISSNDEIRTTKIADNSTPPATLSVEKESTFSAPEIELAHPEFKPDTESEHANSDITYNNCRNSDDSKGNFNSGYNFNTDSDLESSEVDNANARNDNVLASTTINGSSATSLSLRISINDKSMLPITDIDLTHLEDEPVLASEQAVSKATYDNCSILGKDNLALICDNSTHISHSSNSFTEERKKNHVEEIKLENLEVVPALASTVTDNCSNFIMHKSDNDNYSDTYFENDSNVALSQDKKTDFTNNNPALKPIPNPIQNKTELTALTSNLLDSQVERKTKCKYVTVTFETNSKNQTRLVETCNDPEHNCLKITPKSEEEDTFKQTEHVLFKSSPNLIITNYDIDFDPNSTDSNSDNGHVVNTIHNSAEDSTIGQFNARQTCNIS